MAYVELVTKPRKLIPRIAFAYTRRRFHQIVEPAQAAAHHSGVLVAMGAIETVAQRGWKHLDANLRWLAIQGAAGDIGCSWCTDFGYYEGMHQGVDPAKVNDVPHWHTSASYDDRDRTVLEYAQAATATPVVISDNLQTRLHRHFSEEQIVELAAWVALENYRSRFNAGLGLKSEGFKDRCEVPGAAMAPVVAETV